MQAEEEKEDPLDSLLLRIAQKCIDNNWYRTDGGDGGYHYFTKGNNTNILIYIYISHIYILIHTHLLLNTHTHRGSQRVQENGVQVPGRAMSVCTINYDMYYKLRCVLCTEYWVY
jgi:hypothetical protein